LETASGSAITRLGALEVTSGSNITRLGALETASGSAITRLSSIETVTGSNITRLSSLEARTGSYATTGSNTFVGGQYLSSSFNPTGFSTTASLYTDGGLRVSRDAYISGTLYLNNVTVFGTQSVAYISSSQLNIGTNLITVNTDIPSVRFGGLAVYDSGSTGLTGSILWDSQDNQWIYSNPSGSGFDSAMFLVGPRNTGALGGEVGINCNFLSKGNGMHHMTSSGIFENGSVTCFYGNSYVSASGAAAFNSVNILNGNPLRIYNTGNGDFGNLTFATATGFTADKAIQSCDKVGTADNKGFYLRGTSDSTHRLYYNSSDGSNVWEYNVPVKFNFYNTASPTTRMVLDTSGNMCVTNVISAGGCIGVGTTSPQDLLEVVGGTNQGINICASNQPRLGFFVGGTSVDNKIWDFIPQSNNTFIARVVNDAKSSASTWLSVTRNTTTITSICFPQTNPMVISGCVGIGIVPNSAGLRLAACTVLRVEGACSGEVSPDNFGISLGGLGSFRIDAPGVGGGRFVVNSDGNVSIGNPTPANKFTVCGNDIGFQGCPSMRFYVARGCAQTVGSIIFSTGNTSVACGWAEIGQTDANGDLYFKANPNAGGYTTRMVIKGDTGVTIFCCQVCAGVITGDSGATGTPSIVARVGSGGNNGTFGFGNNSNYRIRGGSDYGAMIFDTAGAEAMRIDSNGLVRISKILQIDDLQLNTPKYITFEANISAGANTSLGDIRWYNKQWDNSIKAQIVASTDTDITNGRLSFRTGTDSVNALERMRITSDGRSYFTCQLRVGAEGVASNFFLDIATAGCVVSGVPGTTNGPSISGIRIFNNCSATSNSLVGLWFSTGPHWAGLASGRCDSSSGWGTDLRFYTHEDNTANLDQSTERLRINGNGTVTFFAYGSGTLSTNSAGVISASDGRLKTKTRSVESGLCAIMQLQPTYYRWNECTAFHTEYEELGFIAQEVSCIIPEASPEPEQENKLKNYSDRAIIAMLTKGMQEQQCTINTLKTCLGIA
jgi:hypothetical protein